MTTKLHVTEVVLVSLGDNKNRDAKSCSIVPRTRAARDRVVLF